MTSITKLIQKLEVSTYIKKKTFKFSKVHALNYEHDQTKFCWKSFFCISEKKIVTCPKDSEPHFAD